MRHVIALVACVALTAALPGALPGADTLTWIAGSGDWNVAANWSPAEIPTDNDTLIFPDRAPAAPAVFLNNNLSLAGITLRVGSVRYWLDGNTATVARVIVTGAGGSPIPSMIAMPMVTLSELEVRVEHVLAGIGLRGSIMGIGGLRKTGPGKAALLAANGYGGPTAIDAGILFLAEAGSFGSSFNGTTVASGASLVLQGDIVIEEPLTLAGNGVAPYGALSAENGADDFQTAILNGDITLQGVVRITAYVPEQILTPVPRPEQDLRLSGVITGAGSLLVETTLFGRVILSGTSDNTFTGSTELVRGELRLTKSPGIAAVPGDLIVGNDGPRTPENAGFVGTLAPHQIDDDSDVTVRSAGALRLAGDDGVASLAGGGFIELNNRRLRVGLGNVSSAFAGVISNSLSTLDPPGTGSLRKVGKGTFHWTGSPATVGFSEFGGGVQVEAGVMRIETTLDVDTPVIVDGGTFTGTGSVGVVDLFDGSIEPGGIGSIGTLTCAGFSLGAAAQLAVDFDASGADNVQVNGPVQVNGTLLTRITGGLASTRVILANDGSDAVLGGGFSNWSPPAVVYNAATGNDIAITPTVSVAFSSGTVTLAESTTPVTVTVTIDRAPATPVTVRWSMVEGTALAGFDYSAATGVLTFPAGITAPQTFTISAIDDAAAETTEDFTLLLVNPSSGVAVAAPGSATVSIPYNDGGVAPPAPPASGDGGGGGGGGCGSGGGVGAIAAVGLLMALRLARDRRRAV